MENLILIEKAKCNSVKATVVVHLLLYYGSDAHAFVLAPKASATSPALPSTHAVSINDLSAKPTAKYAHKKCKQYWHALISGSSVLLFHDAAAPLPFKILKAGEPLMQRASGL